MLGWLQCTSTFYFHFFFFKASILFLLVCYAIGVATSKRLCISLRSTKTIGRTMFADDISAIKPFVPIHSAHPTSPTPHALLYCRDFFFSSSSLLLLFVGDLTNDFFLSPFLVYSRYQIRKKEIESCNDNGTTMTTTSNNTNPILTNSTTTQTTQTTTCGYTNNTMVSMCVCAWPHELVASPYRSNSDKRVFTRNDQIPHISSNYFVQIFIVLLLDFC